MDNDQPAIAYQNHLYLMLQNYSIEFYAHHTAMQKALEDQERAAGNSEDDYSTATRKLDAFGHYVSNCFEHFVEHYRTFIPHIEHEHLQLSRHSTKLPPYDHGVYSAFMEKALCDQVLRMEDYAKFIHEEFPDFPAGVLKPLAQFVHQHRIDAQRMMGGKRIEDVAPDPKRLLKHTPPVGMEPDLKKPRLRLNAAMAQLHLTYTTKFLQCFAELIDDLTDRIKDKTLPHQAEETKKFIDELITLNAKWYARFNANLFYPPAALPETFGANVAPEDNSAPFVHRGDLGLRRAIDRSITIMGEGLNAINEKVQASSLVPLENKQAMAQAMLDMQEASQTLFKRPFGGRSSNGGMDR